MQLLELNCCCLLLEIEMNRNQNSIYVIKNTITNDVLYVGRTSREVEKRIKEHYDSARKFSLFVRRDLVLGAHYETLDYDIIHRNLNKHDAIILER